MDNGGWSEDESRRYSRQMADETIDALKDRIATLEAENAELKKLDAELNALENANLALRYHLQQAREEAAISFAEMVVDTLGIEAYKRQSWIARRMDEWRSRGGKA